MGISAQYTLEPGAGPAEAGDGTVSLTEDRLVLQGEKSVYRFTYRDIQTIEADNYEIRLSIEPETRLVFSKLGREYERVVRDLYDRRNAILIEDLLIDESLRLEGIDAQLEYRDPQRNVEVEGDCEVRLYETGIVFLPRTALPVRVPYGTILEVEAENYTIRIETDTGEVALVSKPGQRFDELERTFADLRAALTDATVELLETVLPETDPVVRTRLATLMRDGRAVSNEEVSSSVGTAVWDRLEESLEAAGIGREYEYVASKAISKRVSIGIKRGLRSGPEAEYFWTLVPVGDTDHQKPGNAIVMEAASDSTARATYLFRIAPPDEYVEIESPAVLDQAISGQIDSLNRAMLAINFRREPIYLPREKLLEDRYATYRAALQLVPALERLREAFLGRITHRSIDQWQRDVDELLAAAITPAGEPTNVTGPNPEIED